MLSKLLLLFTCPILLIFTMGAGPAVPDDKASLQGAWTPKSVEVEGKPAPEDVVKSLHFTFDGDKLIVKGDRGHATEEIQYKIDATKSPKQIDIMPPKDVANGKTVLGIYEINGDELKLCFRQAQSSLGRPTDFSTKPDSDLTLAIFTRVKAEKP
jgi:uncharacterized protein (TIGR03067 family)